jgi:hypothetical protein
MEKRRFPRWRLRSPVRVKQAAIEENETVVDAGDISIGGVSFISKKRHAPESELELIIEIPDEHRFIFAKGNVAWQNDVVTQLGEKYIKTGVRFSVLPDADKGRIFRYAYNFCRDDLTKKWWEGLNADQMKP